MEMTLINPWASWEDWFILSKGAIWQLHIWASQTFTAYCLLAAGLKPQRNQLLNRSSLGKARKKPSETALALPLFLERNNKDTMELLEIVVPLEDIGCPP